MQRRLRYAASPTVNEQVQDKNLCLVLIRSGISAKNDLSL